MEDESKKVEEQEDPNKDQFDSLPPELRKMMEQAKQREEAAAAEAQQNADQSTTERSATQGTADGTNDGKELTQTSLPGDRDKSFNGKVSMECLSLNPMLFF